MAGLTHSNHTNPVTRGGFIVNVLMCRGIELPAGANVSPPDPYSAPTTRERYTLHSANDECAGCHVQMDPTRLRARKLRRHRALPSDGKWRPHRRERRGAGHAGRRLRRLPLGHCLRGESGRHQVPDAVQRLVRNRALQAPRPERRSHGLLSVEDGSTTRTGSRSRQRTPRTFAIAKRSTRPSSNQVST